MKPPRFDYVRAASLAEAHAALAADNLQKMGYTNVISMDGGIRGWREKSYPLVKD